MKGNRITMNIDILFNEYIRFFLTLFIDCICTFYIVLKIKEINLTKKRFAYIWCSIIISFLSTILRVVDFPFFTLIYCLVIIVSITPIEKNNFLFLIPTAIISIGITFCMEALCIFILGSIFYFLGYNELNILTEICSSILQLLLLFIFLHIRRFKRGFSFLDNKRNYGFGLLISGPIVIITSLQKEQISNNTLTILILGIVISSIGLFLWIRSAFKRHYRKRLKARAEEYSKLELEEKKKEIEMLSAENSSLSSIIHLDNYLIDKLEKALDKFNFDKSDTESKELISSLKILTNERNEYINKKIIDDKILPSTGNAEADAVITDLYIMVTSRGIGFTLSVDCDINYLIHNIITTADFENLIRGYITRSIVDIENKPEINGKLLISISKPNDIYELSVTDNGTSPSDIGGKISDILDKAKASIRTKEFDSKNSFTKALTIRFDGLNTKKGINVSPDVILSVSEGA